VSNIEYFEIDLNCNGSVRIVPYLAANSDSAPIN
jgi:hypothetical protein